ncbi:MAG TPA: hypothetical protein VE153_27615 [Myxococcus sp.]|nr:hypothetical protein [Myxococcus sp.]
MQPKRLVDVDTLTEKLTDANFLQLAKQSPEVAVKSITESPLSTDKWIYRGVVAILGLLAMTALVGGLVLAYRDATQEIPQMLVALGSTAVGALAGLLAPSPRES